MQINKLPVDNEIVCYEVLHKGTIACKEQSRKQLIKQNKNKEPFP